MKKNRFSTALHHLKSTELDEKIQRLNEAPTNRTGGLYSLNPPGFRLGEKDPAKTFYPDVDGNWPAGIPGIPGELSYTRPEGYWSGGSDWDSINQTDFSQDYLLTDPTGTSTAGLIAENGTVLSQLPPGGQAFILGPIVDGFVPNHTSDAYTNIGYLQKDTRQFVLLARIQGQWKSNLNGNYPIWNGSSGQLTIYNQNFTLAMAEWVKDQIVTSENFTPNVPYFYSGGVPQVPQSDADCPNCPQGMYGGNGVGGNPHGSGGNPNVGTQQGNPNPGNPDQAGYPSWGNAGGGRGGKGGGKGGGGKGGGKGDGPKKPGPKKPDPKKPDPKKPDPKKPDPKKPDPKTPGPKTPGPKTPGPKIVGPKIVGPKIVGPKIVGPKTPGKETTLLGNPVLDKFKLSAKDIAAYKAGGGNAANARGQSIDDVIAQGYKNMGQSNPNIVGPKIVGPKIVGPKIVGDPYTLTPKEREQLNLIKKTGTGDILDAISDIRIRKLQDLDKSGLLKPQDRLNLLALQAFRGYGTAAKGAEVATDVLSTLMLTKQIGQIATKGVIKGLTSLVTTKTPGLSAATKSTIGSTGLDFKGFQAITQGKPYIPSNAPQVLGKGAYSAPQVGKSGGLLGGTGGAKYAGTQGSLGGTKHQEELFNLLFPEDLQEYHL